jgi:DNA mismatch repair protein MutS
MGIVEEFTRLKRASGADVLAMQVGDFYEFFDDDAELVADELDLKISEKAAGGTTHPMAGVPRSELTPYLRALVERGYRVAVADQREEALADGSHEREVVRVVTPGTLVDADDAAARHLGALCRVDGRYGLALVDVTTGRFLATTAAGGDEAVGELARFDPTEVLPGPDVRDDPALLDALRDATDATLTLTEGRTFGPGRAERALAEQFGEGVVDGLGLSRPAVAAAGAAVAYVEATNEAALAAMTRLRPFDGGDHVALDATTRRNLELVEPMTGDGPALLDVVDHTATAAGRRRLREWLVRPSCDAERVERRHDAVGALAAAALARDRLAELLDAAADLERLAARAASGSAGPVALRRVGETLALLPALRETLAEPPLASSPAAELLERFDREAAAALRERVDAALVDDPPADASDGGVFRRGHDDTLDDLIEEHEAVVAWIDGLGERERERTGITHLQVDRNATDGHYIQVGQSETDHVPDDYREIKTLKRSKRFVTDELEEQAREVRRLEAERAERERALFERFRDEVGERADLLRAVGRALADLDALCSLATHAVEADWCRPTLDPDAPGLLALDAARHPVVEQTTEFVPNDLRLDPDRRLLLVTGPNMSGKSTYLRQAALAVVLAQAGSFVPADGATVGPVDAVYTRVGALDELAGGRSTFMVEMEELANILHGATERSLVVLDEVGRGTATYDGISIAWAATEYLHNEVRARTLFATHYHELTGLVEELPAAANAHVAVDDTGDGVTFLRTVREGPTGRSYGVHVADLAGVPAPTVDRAADVLSRLRDERAVEARGGGGDPVQTTFDLGAGEFRTPEDGDSGSGSDTDPAAAAVLAELRELDVDETAPLELMRRLQEWQRRLDG